MSRSKKLAEQTEIRRALLKNGYVPLANLDKRCVLPSWPSLDVDANMIEEWSTKSRFLATGVRVADRLVVVDIDIDDQDVIDALFDALPEDVWTKLDAAPMRFGGGAKCAFFLRLARGESVFGRMVSQAYSPAGQDATQRVEVFAAGAPRQFGVYGPRSEDVDYRWAENRGLVEVPLRALPEITVRDLEIICDTGSRAMAGAGWTYEVKTAAGLVESGVRFDLTDEMEFDTLEHGDGLSLADLEELCGAVDSVRLSAGWLEGPAAVNRSRCIARLNAVDGRLQVWESAGCALHRPAELDLREKTRRLGERLRGAAGVGVGGGSAPSRVGGRESGPEGDSAGFDAGAADGRGQSVFARLLDGVPPESRLFTSVEPSDGEADEQGEGGEAALFAAAVDNLVENWAWLAQGAGFCVPLGETPEASLSLSGLRSTMEPWCKTVAGKRGAEQRVNPTDAWIAHPDRMMVQGFRLMPWTLERVAAGQDEPDKLFSNTYRAPRHLGLTVAADVAERALGVWDRFLSHLIPDARERGWFEMWLAAKVQKPWVPNCGVLMVASEAHGSGRGTLFDMLGAIMGHAHVRPVSSTELMGGGGQGQYTDWLADALVVTCDEVLAGDDSGGAQVWKRREVYERLKTYMDPRPRSMRIVRKGLPAYQTDVFASFLMATNNANALPLDPLDRRLAVITNASVKLIDAEGGRLMADLIEWRGEFKAFGDAFGGAIYGALSQVAVDWDEVREAPLWMVGRANMLAANESDLDEVLMNVLAEVPGDFVLNEHLRARLRLALEAQGMASEVKNWWNRAQDILSRANPTGWRRMAQRQDVQPRGAGRKFCTVYYRVDGAGEKAWDAVDLDNRPDLWRRGSDLNDKVSKVAQAMAARGLRVVDSDAKE